MREQRSKRDRFRTVDTIRFSDVKNAELKRDLVVSILGSRIVLGQRLTFTTDDGGKGNTFFRNAPSLDIQQAGQLVEALQRGIEQISGGVSDGGQEEG